MRNGEPGDLGILIGKRGKQKSNFLERNRQETKFPEPSRGGIGEIVRKEK